jgi:23S rRNA (adenine2030-N6)-methyltransferase
MNYRHAYHAGNFADVVKHAVLALVIEHLKLKPAAFRIIDTHAGIGVYDLASEAARKREIDVGKALSRRGRRFGAVPRRRAAAQSRRRAPALSRQPVARPRIDARA